MTGYISPYEAYPFLSESAMSILCDFELKTDKMASVTGVLISLVEDEAMKAELISICELIYHVNAALRSGLKVSEEEIGYLKNRVGELSRRFEGAGFVLPMGTTAACVAHVLRVQAKEIVRFLHVGEQMDFDIDPNIFDIMNLLSAYFFFVALILNESEGVSEKPFISRNY